MTNETPMMKQYHRIKNKHTDSILLFRLGDFYEMFEKDAVRASSIWNITLTKRNNVPMCGFPYHAADTYISRLIRHGEKIAICEQREDPATAKGIVKRDVVEIMSPGIIVDPNLLDNKHNNCIAAIYGHEKKGSIRLSCACLDVSTGEFTSILLPEGDILDTFQNEIEDNWIREVVYPDYFDDSECFTVFLGKVKKVLPQLVVRAISGLFFDRAQAEEEIKKQFSITSSGMMEFQDELELCSCGAVIAYVRENLKKELSHIRWVKEKWNDKILFIDNATKRHLGLIENPDRSEQATLLSILDKTETPMGGRLLKKYINNPSHQISEINDRLRKVEFFYKKAPVLKDILINLANILDIERILTKLSVGKGNARDLLGLKNSLIQITFIREKLSTINEFAGNMENIVKFNHIIDRLDSCIVDDPPLSIREGGMIKPGFSEKLDQYRKVNIENREWINQYQGEQQRKYGIPSLKVRYNKIIGYYIEVTKPNLKHVPSEYIKKQTLVNAERFTSEELEKHETLLMEARENSNHLETELFEEMRSSILKSIEDLYRTASVIAGIDVHCSLALIALENNYVKPIITEDNIINIEGGRHPVIEKLGDESFIENDLDLNDTDRRIMILTGPNMAGKSTYLRQCAIIIIMAHMGSFVPAGSATIGLVDRVFSRIGMADRIVKGESTFLVEMIETSRILHYATRKSFIIMDEIGRGTSTYDGLSIAWAVLEYLLDETLIGAKVLFATHYHEITALQEREGIINYNATVKEWNNDVIFLRKIVPGSASRSYGVEVAKMAGIPDSIIERAKSILLGLETKYGNYTSLLLKELDQIEDGKFIEKAGPVGFVEEKKTKDGMQFGLFPSLYEILATELKDLEIEKITPLEALNILDRLKRSL
jgi:DNA mismatch repair protein MutS